MKISEIKQHHIAGVTVTFKPKIGEKESYAEAGMRATLSHISGGQDDVYQIHLNYSRFDEYNKGFESYYYYDKDGNATLNGRQAGF